MVFTLRHGGHVGAHLQNNFNKLLLLCAPTWPPWPLSFESHRTEGHVKSIHSFRFYIFVIWWKSSASYLVIARLLKSWIISKLARSIKHHRFFWFYSLVSWSKTADKWIQIRNACEFFSNSIILNEKSERIKIHIIAIIAWLGQWASSWGIVNHFLFLRSEGNRGHMLKLGSSVLPVYCHMTNDLGACGGGGWTLVMKIDGNQVILNVSICQFNSRQY